MQEIKIYIKNGLILSGIENDMFHITIFHIHLQNE